MSEIPGYPGVLCRLETAIFSLEELLRHCKTSDNYVAIRIMLRPAIAELEYVREAVWQNFRINVFRRKWVPQQSNRRKTYERQRQFDQHPQRPLGR